MDSEPFICVFINCKEDYPWFDYSLIGKCEFLMASYTKEQQFQKLFKGLRIFLRESLLFFNKLVV